MQWCVLKVQHPQSWPKIPPKCPRFIKENVKSRGTVFLSMFPPNLVDIMQRERNLYSQQKKRSPVIDNMEALTVLGIMLLSGCSRLPYRRLYWSESAAWCSQLQVRWYRKWSSWCSWGYQHWLGNHGTKQFIREKPTRLCFKLLSLTLSTG